MILVGLLGQSRVMFAMTRDGTLPALFGSLHPSCQTPWISHATMMIGIGLLAAFVPVEALIHMTSVGTLLAFAIVCFGVLVLRRREPERTRPFRVPGGPVVPVLGIAACLLMMLSLPWPTWVRLLGWFALGLAVYACYSHRRASAVRAQQA